MRLAGASTIDQANDVLQEFLPRFNARFAVAAEQQERAYRPVPTELSLTEAICLKHTRKVARDNTVKYQWRVLQLLPGMDRPSYAGLQAEVLERADGELMISYHGETVDFQESPQSSGLVVGRRLIPAASTQNSRRAISAADGLANGHLDDEAQRTAPGLDLESSVRRGTRSGSRAQSLQRQGVVQGKPVRHSVAPDPYSDPAGSMGSGAAG